MAKTAGEDLVFQKYLTFVTIVMIFPSEMYQLLWKFSPVLRGRQRHFVLFVLHKNYNEFDVVMPKTSIKALLIVSLSFWLKGN